jgi:hypothetical protein
MSEQDILDALDAWWVIKQDYDESNAAKAEFQNTMSMFEQGLDRLQQMNAAGDFDQIPAIVKTKWLWAWQQWDTVRDTLKADAEFMASLNWRP